MQAGKVIYDSFPAWLWLLKRQTSICFDVTAHSDEESLGWLKQFSHDGSLVASTLCQHSHTYTHTCICQLQLPIRGCMGQLIPSAEEEICQPLLKMSFYGNHLNNHCFNEEDSTNSTPTYPLPTSPSLAMDFLQRCPAERTNDLAPCQG